MKLSMRLLVVAGLIATAAAQLGVIPGDHPIDFDIPCPANERFARCYSSSCKESMCVDGAVVEPGPMCTMDCRQGCVCAQGFARRGRECVSSDECTGSNSGQVEVEMCETSPGSMCKMLCQDPYMCGEGQCAMLGAGGAMPCCNNYQCQDAREDPVRDPRCANKECGDACSTNGIISRPINGLEGLIGNVGGMTRGRRLTSMMAPDVMMYCQADGSCGMNARPDCDADDDDVEIPERYPDPRCPAPVEGMMSICSVDPTCSRRGACERQGKICCNRACGGLECVFPPQSDPCDQVNDGPDPHRVCDSVEGCAYNFDSRRCEHRQTTDEPDEPNQCEQIGCDEDPCCACHNGQAMMMGCPNPGICPDGREPRPAPGQCCASPNDCQPEPNQCEQMRCDEDPCCSCMDGFAALMDCMPFTCPNGETAQAPAGACCGGPRDCPRDEDCPGGIMRCGGFRPTPELLEACTEDERIYTPGPECTEGCETWTCPTTGPTTEAPTEDLCANNPYIGMSSRDVKRAKKQAKKTIKKYNKLQGKVDAANETKAAKLQRKLDRMAGDLAEAQLMDAQIKALKKC